MEVNKALLDHRSGERALDQAYDESFHHHDESRDICEFPFTVE